MTIPPTMTAAVWDGEHARLEIERIPTPVPRRGEALIEVAACGVCHTDLHVMKGEVAFPGPAVLGHEMSGVVVAVGGDQGTVAIGDRVVGAFIMPCGLCVQCSKGRDDLCLTFFAENRLKGNLLDGTSRLARADGSRLAMYSMAAMAAYAVVPVTALALVPDSIPLPEAAVLGCAAFTAFGAVATARLEPGETVAVIAAGGVGSSIVQVAAHVGASRIVAVDVSLEKLEAARALGATDTVDSRDGGAAAAVRALVPGGVDVAFEALGLPQTFELAAAVLADGGRMVAVGIADRDASGSIPITALVRRGYSIMGSFGARTRRDLPRVVQLAVEGGFDVHKAVSRRYPLAEADAAYAALARGDITGRAILEMH